MANDDTDHDIDLPPDDSIIECWCGARGTYEELFDASGLPPGGCGGLGFVQCECGGDMCVCHHHGEVECDGCEDCDSDEEQFGMYDDDY